MAKMKKALKTLSIQGNKRAMTQKQAAEFGIADMTFTMWGIKIEELRSTIAPYIVEKTKDKPDQRLLDELYGKIFPVWKTVTKFADELLISDSVHDVNSLVGFAETWTVIPDKGSVWTVDDRFSFRKAVEAYLGVKIRQNPVLTGEEKETVEAYNKAVNKIKTNTEKLNGIHDGDNQQNGVLDNIKATEVELAEIEKRIKETTAFMKKAEGDAKNFFELMIKDFEADRKARNAQLAGFKNRKKQLEEQIKKATLIMDANKEEADKIMGRVK